MAQRAYVMDKGHVVASIGPEALGATETLAGHLAI